MKKFVMISILVLLSLVLLSGCHSGGGGSAFWPTAKVSVTVSGLTGTVVLLNNNADELSISSNGTFTFRKPVAAGSGYAVTVKTQPTGQSCFISNGTGKISGANVTNIETACADSGSLDVSFNGSGIVTTMVGTNSWAQAVAIQSDGKIVAAGLSISSRTEIAVARYDSDGSIDPTFGTGGTVITAIGPVDDEAFAVAIQKDDKIVAAGWSNNGGTYEFAVLRYNRDGSLDQSFGTGGIVTTPIGSSAGATAVAIQQDDKIVVAGTGNSAGPYQFAVVRYNSNGSLDSTFGTCGIVLTAVGLTDDQAGAVAIQPDEKIVVAGFSRNNSGADEFAVVRYNGNNGSPDSSFGAGGKVTTSIGSIEDHASGVAIQPNGNIIAAGYTSTGTAFEIAVVRYNGNNGSLDSSFGPDGKVVTAIGSSNDKAKAIALQVDGKIVIAGSSDSGGGIARIALVRYNGSDGSLDSLFGTGGKVTTAIGSISDGALDMAIQPDGKIVAAGGSRYNISEAEFAVVRYIP